MEQNILKSIALMQFNGETFHLANDTAYIDAELTEEVAEYEEDNYDNEYVVMTDEEANEECTERITDSLWAFNAAFICDQIGLPWAAREMVGSLCADKCESANETILAMVENSTGGIVGFIEEAIRADGRSHFMNTYDGNEEKVTVTVDGANHTFYVYRMN